MPSSRSSRSCSSRVMSRVAPPRALERQRPQLVESAAGISDSRRNGSSADREWYTAHRSAISLAARMPRGQSGKWRARSSAVAQSQACWWARPQSDGRAERVVLSAMARSSRCRLHSSALAATTPLVATHGSPSPRAAASVACRFRPAAARRRDRRGPLSRSICSRKSLSRERRIETFAIGGEQGGQADRRPRSRIPARRPTVQPPASVLRDCPAQRSPSAAHRWQGQLPPVLRPDQMSAEDGPQAPSGAGPLELDRTIDPVGIGAGQCSVARVRRPPGPARRDWRRRARRRNGSGCGGG